MSIRRNSGLQRAKKASTAQLLRESGNASSVETSPCNLLVHWLGGLHLGLLRHLGRQHHSLETGLGLEKPGAVPLVGVEAHVQLQLPGSVRSPFP